MLDLIRAAELYEQLYSAYSKLSSELYDTKRRLRMCEDGLQRIRHAGQNEHPTAQWMQKVAAHAMEPAQWPAQPDQPPHEDFIPTEA